MIKVFICIYLAVIVAMFFVTIKDFGDFACTPRQIYEINCELNWFAVWLLFIFQIFTNPLYMLFAFLYWIFHVGRRD